jgi:hypothetical protein
MFAALSPPASAVAPDGGTSNAYGINVTAFGGNLLGPIPAVTLGANGADSGLSQTLPVSVPGLITANTLNVEASSTNFGLANEQISAQAGTEGLTGLNGISLLNTLLNVNAVNSQCNSNASGSTAATQVVGLTIGGGAPLNLPNPIPPNSGLTPAQLGPLAGLVTITLNKQVAHDRPAVNGTNIDVIGLQITLLSGVQTGVVINVSHAFCQATGPDIEAVPNVTSVVPNVGPAAGGTMVTITGTGFTPTSSVDFGNLAAPAASVHFISPTEMTANSPPAAIQNANSTVGVTVDNQYGFGPVPSGPANDFTYEVVPTVLSILPTAGPTTGGQAFTLTGTNFGPDSVVAFGSSQANGALATHIVVNPAGTSLTGVTPPHAAGAVNVVEQDAGGQGILPNGYTYVLAPVEVNSVVPDVGPTAGGTAVVLTGQGFGPADTGTQNCSANSVTVSFGATLAADATCTVVDDSQINVTSPAHIAGPVDVIVTSPAGTSFAVQQDTFTYVAPPNIPSATDIVPDSGTTLGGTTVAITGTGLTDTTSVIFGAATCTAAAVAGGTAGGAPATISANPSDTSLTVVTSAHVAGAVPLCITSAGGTASTGSVTYTYVAPPKVPSDTDLVPDFGPTAGGTTVAITGTGLANTTSVIFGAATCTAAAVAAGTAGGAQATISANPSDTSLTVVTGPDAPGAVPLCITTAGGGTASTGSVTYLYVAPPLVGTDGLNPAYGPTTGGTTVVITGVNLTGTSSVLFDTTSCAPTGATGGYPATIETGGTDTSVTIVTPASHLPGDGAGPVDVCITANGGTAPAAEPFTYESVPPGVSSLNPTAGPVAGGQTVTITGSGFGAGDPATTVAFGSNQGSMVDVVSTTQITVVTPASTLPGDGHGKVDVTVHDSGGSTTLSQAYTYVVTPIVTGISPTSGPLGGGETVIIKGSGLCGATSVPFGSNNATIISNSTDCTQLNVTEPAGMGTVPVYVVTPGGTARSPENFTYIQPGYWLAASDGGIFSFGGAQFLGSVPGQLQPGQKLNSPIVAMADTPDHGGYWLFAADGGVFSFGDAAFYGSIPEVLQPGQVLNGPVVTAEATPDGLGYRMFAADGGVFDFGDAAYEGGLPGENIFPTSPVSGATAYPFDQVGIKPFPGADTAGYWLVLANGGVYSFGNAPTTIGSGLGQIFGKVVALATTPDGEGYYMFLQGGAVASFGDASRGLGSATSPTPVVFGQATSTGLGYWIFSANGSVYTFGDAPFEGSTSTQGIQHLNQPITAAIAFGAS